MSKFSNYYIYRKGEAVLASVYWISPVKFSELPPDFHMTAVISANHPNHAAFLFLSSPENLIESVTFSNIGAAIEMTVERWARHDIFLDENSGREGTPTLQQMNTDRRNALYATDSRCHWCGRFTQRARGVENHPLTATLDHLYPKGHPLRKANPKEEIANTVLSCYECNTRRNMEFQRERSNEV